MKTNGVLTMPPLRGKVKLKKSVNRVIDPAGALICGVSAYGIFDLNGKKIARYARTKKTDAGSMRKYEGLRTFWVKDGLLLSESGKVLGTIEQGGRSVFVPVAVALSILLAVVLLIVAVLGFPVSSFVPADAMPVLVISTDGERWGAEEELEIFDGKIAPGSSGEYVFEISNPTDYGMEYTLSLTDDNDWGGRSPIQYRLRMNNVYIGEGWTAMGESEGGLSVSEIRFNSM